MIQDPAKPVTRSSLPTRRLTRYATTAYVMRTHVGSTSLVVAATGDVRTVTAANNGEARVEGATLTANMIGIPPVITVKVVQARAPSGIIVAVVNDIMTAGMAEVATATRGALQGAEVGMSTLVTPHGIEARIIGALMNTHK